MKKFNNNAGVLSANENANANNYSNTIKKWNSLTFTDDFIFCKVLQNPEICKELLEILLNIKITKLEYVNKQQVVDPIFEAKGIRLDVYVDDGNRVFDIEMQTSINSDLSKRARYYASAMDIELLNQGQYYSELKESFVIFICTKDPFGKDYPIYSFENICKEDKNLNLDDKTHKIFYNASAYNNLDANRIKDFLDFVTNGVAKSDFTSKLQDNVVKIKSNRNWRSEYMTMEMKLHEREQIGIEQGIAIGEAKGRSEGRTEGIHAQAVESAKILKSKGMDLDFIQQVTGLSINEINNLK